MRKSIRGRGEDGPQFIVDTGRENEEAFSSLDVPI